VPAVPAGPPDSMPTEVARPSALLLKLRGSRNSGFAASAAVASGAEVLIEVGGSRDDGLQMSASSPATWVRLAASDNPWDQAHDMMRRGFALGGGEVVAAEPEFEQQWVGGAQITGCDPMPQTDKGGVPKGPQDLWHLQAEYAQFLDAQVLVPADALARVKVAHLDTGYDPAHSARPALLDHAGERSFVHGDKDPLSARDETPTGGLPYTRNRGHGTGTIGILAGRGIGAAPGATILPIRIADSVVRFKTGTMAQGFAHALHSGANVLSMSMGGLASQMIADIVNDCYEAGLVMVTAAGNNFGGLPIASIVYPARMRRVVAACGVMANGKPYAGLPVTTMEGCFGPASKMATALSGYTPNLPWPRIGCGATIDQDGCGTSAATPQLAAAAALWIAAKWDALQGLPAWQRGEAARQALFQAASLGAMVDEKLGQGAVRARAMLDLDLSDLGALVSAPRADASWDWLKLLTGRGVGFAQNARADAESLLGVELAQMHQRDPEVARELPDPDAGPPLAARRRALLKAAEASPLASRALKAALGAALVTRKAASAIVPPPPPPVQAPRKSKTKPPARRRLRVFALDPSLGASLNSFESQIATIDVRNEPDLQPGPVGEYVEVVDVDPASNRFYPPVDLNDPNLMLQDGNEPSEGNPAFHQQMAYAISMRTIEAFEEALGRPALWASRWNRRSGAPNEFVRRLRIYPHAFRGDNAYYSPDHKALLFGYFPASSKVSDLTPPGTMVFSCLSSDIIAHETTHALLDGQARGFREPSNPDVRAFHEAFADVVALFQQFTYRDLVRREIGNARGDLSAAGLLGGLARQFGEGTGKSGPLRSYPHLPDGISYETTLETHDRGSILVAAVYDAFLGIVERRTGDLIRLATGGSGILPAGALLPDLTERLTDETCKAARHVLNMCIRAIDYTPPVDITFGEYLRALITADLAQVPDDRFGYRVAFLEAFRRLQLLPRSLRTVSVETLQWRTWNQPQPAWLGKAVAALGIDVTANCSREQAFNIGEDRRREFRRAMLTGLTDQAACDPLGLQYMLPYYRSLTREPYHATTTFMIDNPRVATRMRPDGSLSVEVIVVARQQRPEGTGPTPEDTDRFWFRGGSTLVIDPLAPGGPAIRHAIVKPITSRERLERERAFRSGDGTGLLRKAYFGTADANAKGFGAREPFALIHAERTPS
jgi:hypothetical protein